jgi:hypothetical protein
MSHIRHDLSLSSLKESKCVKMCVTTLLNKSFEKMFDIIFIEFKEGYKTT